MARTIDISIDPAWMDEWIEEVGMKDPRFIYASDLGSVIDLKRFDDYRIIGEHECEICGCTESKACPAGCEWSERFKESGRWICTECECRLLLAMTYWMIANVRDLYQDGLLMDCPILAKNPGRYRAQPE
jgi:hypothetical protein